MKTENEKPRIIDINEAARIFKLTPQQTRRILKQYGVVAMHFGGTAEKHLKWLRTDVETIAASNRPRKKHVRKKFQ